MTARVVKLVYDAIAGHPALAPRLQRMVAPDECSILMYHGLVGSPLPVGDGCFLEADVFRRQMEYLASRCRVVSLHETLQPPTREGRRQARVALTFDDGFMSVRDLAYPVLLRLRLPATVFLATGFVGTGEAPWFCHVHKAVIDTRKRSVSWEGRTLDLGDPRSRAEASGVLQEEIKALPPGEIPAVLARLARLLEVPPPGDVPPGSPWRMLDVGAVREMAATGLIDFGAHTSSHAILSGLAGEARREEIRASIGAVAGLTGRPCRSFAYPNGRAEDFSGADIAVLREEGITAAVTTEPAGVGSGADPWRLGRYHVADGTGFSTFVATVHNLRRRAARGRGRG